ncbi:DsbA family protein [Streptomyces mutabilis]|uniref:DsbA family protein n=1 Tax=Streptomyces mutabilis TaxID=67332 RepID=UPI001781D2C8|nr:DsbA family protein [Streptomyces mutabilis]GGQ19393.1 DsbA family protein [Streptomyces mutabilis]
METVINRLQLTYAFDAYCGWCYGFGPAVRAFATDNADRVTLQVLSGGLFSGNRAQPIGAFPHIPGANKRISELTGVEFGAAYERVLAEGTLVMDSTDAATGLVALRRQRPAAALELAGAMQRAWYIDGRSLSDPEVYRDIAEAHAIDPGAVNDALTDPAVRVEAERDMRELRQLDVDHYPTLLLRTSAGLQQLGGPVSSAAALTAALDQHLSRSE